MKTGLILEGGAMRGMFTCGVLDVLLEEGISFHGMVGVSAGAAFGCNFKSRQIGRALRYNQKYCRDPRYVSLRSLLKTGDLYGANFAYSQLPWKLDLFDSRAFRENPMEFYVVCTDMMTGKPVYHRCTEGGEEDVLWMRASASMPAVSRPVEIDGLLLSDGGTADSIPVRFFEGMGYDRNVVVLTQPKGYVKKESMLTPLLKPVLRKTPELYRTLKNRPRAYNSALAYIDRQEVRGSLLVLRPRQALHIGKVERNPEELGRVYRLGREEAASRLGEIKAFLSGEPT